MLMRRFPVLMTVSKAAVVVEVEVAAVEAVEVAAEVAAVEAVVEVVAEGLVKLIYLLGAKRNNALSVL